MLEGSFKALEEYGWAGFFAFQYIVTVWFLIRLLIKDRNAILATLENEKARTERIATIIEKSVESDKRVIEAMTLLKTAVQDDMNHQRETMAYLKAKDEMGRRS